MNTSKHVTEIFAPVLSRLQTDAASHYGIARLRLAPVTCEERPFSYVMRLGVWHADDGNLLSHVFVKVLKPKVIKGGPDAMQQRIARDYATTCRTYAAMLPHGDVGAVPPVACYPDLLTIVTEQVEGPTLLAHLEARARWFPGTTEVEDLRGTMATVGRWIRVFQTTGETAGNRSTEDLRHYIDKRLTYLVTGDGKAFTEHDRSRVLAHIDLLGRHIDPEELRQVPIHADMSLGNILVSGPRIVVLDFTMARAGNSLHDLTRIFVQLDLLSVKPQMRTSVISRLQQGLLEGFDPSLSPDRPLFRLLVLLHRVNHLATLTVNRASMLKALYNRRVRRQHRRLIDDELSRGGAQSGHA